MNEIKQIWYPTIVVGGLSDLQGTLSLRENQCQLQPVIMKKRDEKNRKLNVRMTPLFYK